MEMTKRETELFNEMKKLSKRANQRIVRLERLTNVKEPFAVKQLADKLSTDTLKVWTEKGRVGVKKGLTELQMKAIIKATNEFLSKNSVSTQAQVKAYQEKVSLKAGKKLSIKQAETEYQLKKNYEWIYDYMTPSEYWGGFVKEAKERHWEKEKFTDELISYMGNATIDDELIRDVEHLYDYSMEGV